MRKKSFEQVVGPDDPESERSGAYAAMMHAMDMAGRGHFTPAEMRDLQRLFGQAYRDTMDGSEYDAMRKDGRFDQLQDLCGYADGEDPDEVDARCHALGVQVVAHFFASAAQTGLIEPQRALAEIAKYVSLPTANSAEGVIGAVLDALNAGQRLSLAGDEAGQPVADEEVDQALGRMTDRHGRVRMRRREDAGAPSEAEIEEYLDQAVDRKGRPMFPREREEE
jgi:hypothetical protein